VYYLIAFLMACLQLLFKNLGFDVNPFSFLFDLFPLYCRSTMGLKQALKNFDAFPRAEEHLTQKTSSGAIGTPMHVYLLSIIFYLRHEHYVFYWKNGGIYIFTLF
jgi:hypothetical protein